MAYTNVAQSDLGASYSGANFNEIFLQPVFTDEDIMSNYRVIPNVRHTMNLYTADELKCIVQSYSGCDDTGYAGKDFDVNLKTITAGRMRVALEQCQDQFFGTYIEESYRAGLDVFNLQGTDLMDTIMMNVKRGISNDLVKLAWFGDTTDDSECFSSTDGFLKLLTAAGNAIAWTDGALGANDAVDQMRAVYEGADAALLATPNNEKCIWVTPNVYFNYVASIENLTTTGFGGDTSIMRAEDGKAMYMFRGVEVKPMYSWVDAISVSDWTDDQIIVFAAKKNLVLGTDTNAPENELKFWYDEYREKMIIRSYFKFGCQYTHDALVSWSSRVTT